VNIKQVTVDTLDCSCYPRLGGKWDFPLWNLQILKLCSPCN